MGGAKALHVKEGLVGPASAPGVRRIPYFSLGYKIIVGLLFIGREVARLFQVDLEWAQTGRQGDWRMFAMELRANARTIASGGQDTAGRRTDRAVGKRPRKGHALLCQSLDMGRGNALCVK